MELPKLTDFDFRGKKVLVRADLDVPLKEGIIEDDSRIREALPTIQYLLDHAAKVILLGHLGRPEGKVVEDLRMRPVALKLIELLEAETKPLGAKLAKLEFKNEKTEIYLLSENLKLLENLRFDPREESNDPEFAKERASLGDFYVNEAFATSHREHASIVGLPKLLPHAAGFHFFKEVENLSKAIENPKKPLVLIIGGAKPETKLPLAFEFAKKADLVLVGGTLIKKESQENPPNVLFATLTNDGFDIEEESIKKFSDIIKTAGTIIWSGPMGKYEEERWSAGTKGVAQAVAECPGFKLVGGGDTIAALKKFNLLDKMDYVSTAGGAMLEYLAKGTLPGIEALK